MKLRKIAIAILLVTVFVAQFSGIALAAGETQSNQALDVVIGAKNPETDLAKLNRNDEFELLVHMNNLRNIGKGVMTMGGTLNYNDTVLELKSITGENRWEVEYNQNNGKFVLVRKKVNLDDDIYVTTPSNVFSMRFTVKADAVEPSNATIALTSLTASGGDGIIRVNDANVSVTVVKPEEKPKSIESAVYTVNNTDKDITKIVPKTTVAQFKENIIANNIEDDELIFTKGETVLNNNSVLTTGTVLTVANTDIRYTIIVKGDIDGEIDEQGRVVTENDLAKIKLHFIEAENAKITGIWLKAADYDLDGNITVNDIAIIKLIILDIPGIKM